MQLMKDMGVNFIRLGHYQQSDIILQLCDSLGILVWEEIPWCRGGLGHCLSYSGMIFMAVRSLKQKTPAIQEERAFFLKFELAETEAFFRCQCLYPSTL